MQRKTRLSRRTVPKKKMGRLQVFDKKVHQFVHELGHDIDEFGDDVHKFFDEVEDRLDEAGHTYHETVKILKSKKNRADYSFLMATSDDKKRKMAVKEIERSIHERIPYARFHWGLEKGKKHPWENDAIFQDFRITGITLEDALLIHSILSIKGLGGFKF